MSVSSTVPRSSLSSPAARANETNWRVRLTPDRGGAHRVTGILRNGKPIDAKELAPREFTSAEAKVAPGMVRRDPSDSTRLVFENGTVYYTYSVTAPDPFVAPYFSFLQDRLPKDSSTMFPRRKDEYPG